MKACGLVPIQAKINSANHVGLICSKCSNPGSLITGTPMTLQFIKCFYMISFAPRNNPRYLPHFTDQETNTSSMTCAVGRETEGEEISVY